LIVEHPLASSLLPTRVVDRGELVRIAQVARDETVVADGRTDDRQNAGRVEARERSLDLSGGAGWETLTELGDELDRPIEPSRLSNVVDSQLDDLLERAPPASAARVASSTSV